MAAEQGGRETGPAAAAWLVWSVLGSTLLLLLAGVGLMLGVEPGTPYDSWLILLVNAPVFATIGAVLAARRPDHPIGWLFCGIGLANAAQLVTGSYATAAMSRALPGGAVAAWVTEELRLLAFGAIVLSLLLFPTGRLPSWRWRWVVGLGAVGLASLMAREGLTPGPSQELLGHRNPFGLTGVPGLLDGLSLLEELFYMAELAAVLSLVLRLRRARGVERQQLKWFVYAAVLAVVVLVLAHLLFYDLMEHGPLGNLLWGAAPVSLAVAVAVAVLRYRLYEIDRLVNRTLVYGLVTALLAGVYAGGVFLLGRLLDPADGQSELAVAASTLAVAGLFQPARRRVQQAVDRRFDRRRYDAARTVEGFQRPAAGRAGPGHPVVGAAGGGRPDRPAGRRVAVAAARIGPAVTGTVTMPERWDGTTAPEEVP
jgi:hypothetical protein